MSDTGWEAAKRLGVQVGTCAQCAGLLQLLLPIAGRSAGERHWRVEVRKRAYGLDSGAENVFICCSQGCAQKKKKALDSAWEHFPPRMNRSVHGPYEPYVES